jgi:hypothetical protein
MILSTLHALIGAAILAHAPEPVIAVRGIASKVEIDPHGSRLIVRPNQSPDSPVFIRLLSSQPGASKQTIEFMGVVAGNYDLRELLMHENGSDATDLEPITVKVESRLRSDQLADVYGLANPDFSLAKHYRTLLLTFGALWVAVPLIVVARRLMARKPVMPPPPPAIAPTLTEEIIAMLDQCGDAPMTVAQKGRLELLILKYWSQSTDGSEMSGAVAKVRQDPRTRDIVIAVEEWLHRPHAGADAQTGAQTRARARLREFREQELISAGSMGVMP